MTVVKDGPSCPGCGLSNYEGMCPHCRGDQAAYEDELVPPFPTSLGCGDDGHQWVEAGGGLNICALCETEEWSTSDRSAVERAREAAVGALGTYESSPPSFKVTMRSVAEVSANAAVRLVLEHLREHRQHAPGESFGHLISVVPVAVIDALLKELGDA